MKKGKRRKERRFRTLWRSEIELRFQGNSQSWSEDIMNEKVDEEKPKNEEGMEMPVTILAGLSRVTYQEAAEVIQEVGPAVRKKRGRPRKDGSPEGEGLREAISPGPSMGSVADRGVGGCVDPEGNGVTMVRGAEGGPGPPSGEQDKQLIQPWRR